MPEQGRKDAYRNPNPGQDDGRVVDAMLGAMTEAKDSDDRFGIWVWSLRALAAGAITVPTAGAIQALLFP